MNKIIDMRNRPALLHDFFGATSGTPEYDVVRWLNRRTGSKNDEHFLRSRTLDGFVAEIRESGISAAVVVARETPGLTVSNDRVGELIAGQQELIGIGSVDVQTRGPSGALAEIERAIGVLGLKGINIEPGFGNPALRFDDPALFPVYDACAQLRVPVFLMSGPTSPSLEFTDPAPVGRVAAAFPKLSIACYHGFYPYVNEAIGIAFRHENVSIIPDMYLFLPGGKLYVEAGNGFMKHQLLFGTSYPFRAMSQTVDDFQALDWDPDVLHLLLHENAERLLNLKT